MNSTVDLQMTITDAINPMCLKQDPTAYRTTRYNTPGTVPVITAQEQPTRKSTRLNPSQYAPVMAPVIATAPNSECMPYFNRSHLISQEAVNLLPEKVYDVKPGDHWIPHSFITASPTKRNDNLDLDVEHFCSPIIHPT